MDSKLKLQIVTALDNAGIKATEQQINTLTNSIGKFNQKSGNDVSKLENALGKMPGKLGQIQGAFGKISGTIGLIVGSLYTGIEIGTKISNFLKEHWKWYGDIFKRAEKHTKELAKQKEQFEKHVESLAVASEKSEKYWNKQQEHAEKLTKEIQNQTKAYITQTTTRNELLKSADNGELIRLQREEFEDALRLESEGVSQETLDQLHATYDILKKELEIKQKMVQFDEQNVIVQKQLTDKERELYVAKGKSSDAEYALLEARQKLKDLEDDDTAWWSKDYDKKVERAKRVVENAEKRLQQAYEAEDAKKIEVGDIRGKNLLIEQNRANLYAQLTSDRDISALNYDRLISNNGDLLGIGFTKEFTEQLNNTSVQSYNELKEITQNTGDLARKLDELLGLKGF